MSSKKELQKISLKEIEKVNISTLADRPNSGSRYGVGDLTAHMLKARFDAFPALVAERLNAICDALSSQDASKYIGLAGNIGGADNLYDFVNLFKAKVSSIPNASDYIEALYTKMNAANPTSETLQAIVDDISAHIGVIDVIAENHEQRIADEETKSADHDQRLKYMEEYINDALATEDSLAYQVDVPAESRDTAKILSIGGMTYKSRNLFNSEKLLEADDWQEVDGVYKGNSSLLYRKFNKSTGEPLLSGVFVVGKKYTFSLDIAIAAADGTATVGLYFLYTDGTTSTLWYANKKAKTRYTFTSDASKVIDSVRVTSATGTDTELSNICCYEGTDTVYEPYFEGLRNAAVEKVRSEGKNICPINSMTYPFTDTVIWRGSVSGDYVLSWTNNLTNMSTPSASLFRFTFADGSTKNIAGTKTNTYYAVSGTLVKVELLSWTAPDGGSVDNIQLEAGKTPTKFSPFIGTLDTFAIPQAVQSIDGYGEGINGKVCNYADFVNKQFVNMLGRIYEPKVLTTSKHENGQRYAIVLAQKPKANGAVISTNYSSSPWSDKDKTVYSIGGNIIINDSRFSSIEEAQSILIQENTIVFYELETPIVTDISSLLTENNLIKVEGGGTLTFENEYGYAVPSSVEWRLESSHRVAFEHSQTKGNPHETTAAEVGAYTTKEVDEKLAGYVPLIGGQIPSSYLPSYVDDVLSYDSLSDFPEVGEDGKIYIDRDTNKSYRWNGAAYTEISKSLALGETEHTAYRGDRGKIAYDHSQITKGNPHGITIDDILPVTAADNGKFLQVVDGKWCAVTAAAASEWDGSFTIGKV